MSLLYEIDVEKGVVSIVGKGGLPMSTMIDVVDAVAEDHRFRSNFTVIFDLRHADYAAEISGGEAFVSALKRRQDDFLNRFALVVPEHLHVLAKLYSVLADVGGFDRMQCFLDIEEARRWCGLPEDGTVGRH